MTQFLVDGGPFLAAACVQIVSLLYGKYVWKVFAKNLDDISANASLADPPRSTPFAFRSEMIVPRIARINDSVSAVNACCALVIGIVFRSTNSAANTTTAQPPSWYFLLFIASLLAGILLAQWVLRVRPAQYAAYQARALGVSPVAITIVALNVGAAALIAVVN